MKNVSKILATSSIDLTRLIFIVRSSTDVRHMLDLSSLKVFDSHHPNLCILITKVPFTPYRANYSCKLPPAVYFKENCENYETHVAIFFRASFRFGRRVYQRRKMHPLNEFTSRVLPFPCRAKRYLS